jgi:hypothetical protein
VDWCLKRSHFLYLLYIPLASRPTLIDKVDHRSKGAGIVRDCMISGIYLISVYTSNGIATVTAFSGFIYHSNWNTAPALCSFLSLYHSTSSPLTPHRPLLSASPAGARRRRRRVTRAAYSWLRSTSRRSNKTPRSPRFRTRCLVCNIFAFSTCQRFRHCFSGCLLSSRLLYLAATFHISLTPRLIFTTMQHCARLQTWRCCSFRYPQRFPNTWHLALIRPTTL